MILELVSLEWVHPGLLLILGAWALLLLKSVLKRLAMLLLPAEASRSFALFLDRYVRVAMLLLPAAAVVVCVCMTPGTFGKVSFLGRELVFGRVDKLSLIFSYVFSLMAFLGMVYALHVKDDAQHVTALTYAGGALGVTFAGDFLSLYVFWELMAISSVFLVWLRREPSAVAAGFRYLLVHVFGGLILLAGIMLLSQTGSGSLDFGNMRPVENTAAWTLILVAFLLNAAVPPLGAWLPDAYPEATVTGAVFMTAFTTKSAVYVLIRGFAGTDLLVWLGAAMAVYGVVYAVLENDARRLLAYHIISQVGYMVCGVGIGTALALNGATAHAFAHILYKALLFMGAGAVLQVTGLRKLSEMGGLYKTMPITLGLYMIGAFAISAVPLFSGFVSKSMVVSATGDPLWNFSLTHRELVFLTLTLASAGTFLHTGLKLPYYMFFGKDSGVRGQEPPRNMLVAMALAAFACMLIGVMGFFPDVLYQYLPYSVDYVPYTLHHVTATLGMLGFTALGFFLLLKQLDPERKISLDTDWFYRRGSAACRTLTRQQISIRFSLGITATGLGWLILTGRLNQLLSGWQQPELLKTLGWLSAGIGLVLLCDLVLGISLARGRLARLESGFVGEIYEFVMRRPVFGAAGLFRKFDTHVVDSAAVGVGRLTQAFSQILKTSVSGNAQHYGLMMAAGVLALLVLAILVL